jgi:ParB/RepB/Spo0J family partition protein
MEAEKFKNKDTKITMSKFAQDLAKNPQQEKYEKLKQLIGKQVTLPIASIRTDENIRSDLGIEQEAFKELVASIQEHGILQNVVVELRERNDAEVFDLVCVEGHRRIAASKQVGLETVPCFLKVFQDRKERNRTALACTLKEDLHPIDRAAVYADWLAAGANAQEIAEKDNKNLKTIQRFLKILDWPPHVRELVRQNKSAFPTWWLFQTILQKSLSNAQVESLLKNKIREAESKKTDEGNLISKRSPTPQFRSFAVEFGKKFGHTTRIKMRSGKEYMELELSPELVSRLKNLL